MTSFEMKGLITFDKDGSVILLPGYMFDPIDEVLIDFYLKRRAFDQPLPVQIIPDFDVFQTEPWNLPRGDSNIFNEPKFFFYNTMGRDLEILDTRVAGSGRWRVVEKGRNIPIPRNNQLAGKRNTFIFWEVQGYHAIKTKWVMHEFRLVSIVKPSKIANWIVYRIFQKKDAKKVKNPRGTNGDSSNGGIMNDGSAEVINFNVEGGGSISDPPPIMTHSLSEGNESA